MIISNVKSNNNNEGGDNVNQNNTVSVNTDTPMADRTFVLNGDIDENSIGSLCKDITKLIVADDENANKYINFQRVPITIFIQSFGGSIYDAWSLIDIMLSSNTPIYTICTGYAMSAAFLIFIAGSARVVTNHAQLMYHQISSGYWGKVKDVIEDTEWLKKDQERVEEFVLNRTLLTKEELDESYNAKKDLVFSGKECIIKGIADNLWEDNYHINIIDDNGNELPFTDENKLYKRQQISINFDKNEDNTDK